MRNVQAQSPDEIREIRAKNARIQKDLRQWRKNLGMCTRCGKEIADYGTLCHNCREKNNTSRRKRR